LTDAELERYIDDRIQGRARRLAARYMRVEPICHRENVMGIADVPYSNTWEGLQHVSKEFNSWQRQSDGSYRDSQGDVLTPSRP
jgi:hypothetical protein